jgi:hypothetical protein
MNCDQMREAMDTGIPQDIVQSHLSGCSDCTEWSSLLKLLGTQPRVQAPANFDARLQARLASEEVKLLALVNSLLPVNAPADFDFRLRGRLAQAKAEKAARSPLVGLAELWASSFSLGRATTALAAVALIVAFSALQLTRNNNQSVTTTTDIARVQANQPGVVTPSTQPMLPVAHEQIAKATARVPRQAAPTMAKAFVATPAVETLTSGRLIASNASERYVYDSVTGQETKMVSGGVAYGQQLANLVRPSKAEPVGLAF